MIRFKVTYIRKGKTHLRIFYSEKDLDRFADSGIQITSIKPIK